MLCTTVLGTSPSEFIYNLLKAPFEGFSGSVFTFVLFSCLISFFWLFGILSDIQKQAAYEAEQMERLRSEGRGKTATFRQYLGNRMLYQAMLARYCEYGLIGEQAQQ